MPDIIPHLIWGYICIGAFGCGIAHGMGGGFGFRTHFALFFAWPAIWFVGAFQNARDAHARNRDAQIEGETRAAFDEIQRGARRTDHRFTLGDQTAPAQKNQD